MTFFNTDDVSNLRPGWNAFISKGRKREENGCTALQEPACYVKVGAEAVAADRLSLPLALAMVEIMWLVFGCLIFNTDPFLVPYDEMLMRVAVI